MTVPQRGRVAVVVLAEGPPMRRCPEPRLARGFQARNWARRLSEPLGGAVRVQEPS